MSKTEKLAKKCRFIEQQCECSDEDCSSDEDEEYEMTQEDRDFIVSDSEEVEEEEEPEPVRISKREKKIGRKEMKFIRENRPGRRIVQEASSSSESSDNELSPDESPPPAIPSAPKKIKPMPSGNLAAKPIFLPKPKTFVKAWKEPKKTVLFGASKNATPYVEPTASQDKKKANWTGFMQMSHEGQAKETAVSRKRK